jgi:hypothetical protein
VVGQLRIAHAEWDPKRLQATGRLVGATLVTGEQDERYFYATQPENPARGHRCGRRW